jgi:hypothetical protein
VIGSVRDDVHSPSARIPFDHARHDRLLVTRFAADDAYPTELAEAKALVERCNACAALAEEIRLLRAALTELPAPRRPRDFRLTQQQADELRGTALTRLLRRLAAPGMAPLRPVAGVAMSIGLALAVVGTTMPAPPAVDESLENAAFPELRIEMYQEPASGGEPPPGIEAPAAGEDTGGAGRDGDAATDRLMQVGAQTDVAPESGMTRDLLIYIGLAIALLSLALLVLVTIVRMRWRDPLLR